VPTFDDSKILEALKNFEDSMINQFSYPFKIEDDDLLEAIFEVQNSIDRIEILPFDDAQIIS
jgi:hypothetical protein